MKTLLKAKWLVIGIWIAGLAALIIFQPNMSKLVREHGQPEVPDGYSSKMASDILNEYSDNDSSQTALVFHTDHAMTDQDKNTVKSAINTLKSDKDSLGIESVTSYFDNPDAKDQFVSDNKKTILASLQVNLDERTAAEAKKALYNALDDVDIDHYYTGDWLINEDYTASIEDGMHQTEYLTIIFILIVLLVVFRSVITPLIPLVTVGITYIASQSIVAWLVKLFDFPLSNFTQIFLVAVLFGIGTDYCILLLSRFKEELPRHESITDAIAQTYKSGGRTVFFSGLAVLVGFSTIGLSKFSTYQSSVGVAIGIIILIIALVTIVPILMLLLGRKMFWPSKKAMEHNESRLWGAAGRFSLKRPLLSLLIVAAVTVPFIITDDGLKSFNTLEEIGNEYKSVQGFNILSDNFGAGEAMPTQVVIENDEKMDQRAYLQTIEGITRELKTINHVDTVRSVTQPKGEPIEDFLVPNQAQTLDEGIADANDGIDKIADGLKQAQNQLNDSKPKLKKAVNGFDPLISGTSDLQSGVKKLKTNLVKIQNGLEDGAQQIDINKLKQAKQSAQQLADKSQKLLNNYQKIGDGIGTLQKKYTDIQSQTSKLSKGLSGIQKRLKKLGNDHPDIKDDTNYQKIVGTTGTLLSSTQDLSDGLGQLNKQLGSVASNIKKANNGLSKIVDGQKQFASQMQQTVDGLSQLQTAMTKLANGQQQIINNVPSIQNGLSDIKNGQKQLQNGFSPIVSQLDQMASGLGDSVNGLNKVSNGLGDARGFLDELSQNNSSLAGFYIPDEALEGDDFVQSLDQYMSDNRKMTTISVLFDVSPYSTTAIDQIDDIKSAVDRATDDTKLENAHVGVGGATSNFADLRNISDEDYSRTVMLMLIGIGIILIGLLRSLIMPIYILGSLLLTYYTAMGVTELIFVNLLDYTGINWAVPFFGFVMLIALGVDYSIFLMDRFNEYKDIDVKTAIIEAMKHMGTVIMSAAVILGGTFAAMMPSGVVVLMEIATIIITGLILYNIFILPLFIPVMVKIFGKANWWPFKRNDD
ncbi:MMPL family transporter [Tuberibacillus sp. Marseille-P3662]|uniref:MMPL family transporter n=1 Tax=Tuberibacillus sp. Marseille-P3662 TaxID=1965358 RepID=UPI000A1CA5B7|nr:MMPL family transporter [Tuberibacillus sp. Marseille-P3662]